ncbi:uncharacterized protein LOC130718538 [Lotus japonicus]|uniref:uncharacterized protein LOC130718538 n=1 Tax=Lotus japonicus TaxID=34305 RepID=UPI002589AE93|nr:uncharacterized protein LOC130718538 [Lotus japonicus]
MFLWLSKFYHSHLTITWPLVIYAATWVTLLTLTVAVASFSPEVAFVSAISPSSSFSQKCSKSESDGSFIRVPLDNPSETLCLPAQLFAMSSIDIIVPPVFSALMVAASACVVRAVGLLEHD